MQYKSSDIYTINNVAPPSYTEAMGLPTSTRNDSHVPASNQPTSYHQEYPQTSGYPSSSPCQHPNIFHSNIPVQPSYNPTYATTAPNEQNQPVNTLYITSQSRQTNKKICCYRIPLILQVIFFFIMISVFISIILKVFRH